MNVTIYDFCVFCFSFQILCVKFLGNTLQTIRIFCLREAAEKIDKS